MTAGAPWIRRPRPVADPRARLFCVPHGGGGPSFYARWVTALAPDVEVCLVHLPGRESRRREEPVADLVAAAGHAVACARELFDRPFAFLGHSMGSIVAYEAARSCPVAPRHLFVSACPAPDRVDRDARIAHLPDAGFLAAIRDLYSFIPDDVWANDELMAIMLPALRADFTAYETYAWTAGPALPCDVTALGGRTDPTVPEPALDGWRGFTAGRFQVRMFDGGHFYLTEHRPAVLDLVRAALG